ncbi:MAG: hypothetical protein LQ340_000241 [Diploschistes diacapsis]|nr:MAG: hypothetical protein LQ340_000241 [Diploschistes diacapsis]
MAALSSTISKESGSTSISDHNADPSPSKFAQLRPYNDDAKRLFEEVVETVSSSTAFRDHLYQYFDNVKTQSDPIDAQTLPKYEGQLQLEGASHKHSRCFQLDFGCSLPSQVDGWQIGFASQYGCVYKKISFLLGTIPSGEDDEDAIACSVHFNPTSGVLMLTAKSNRIPVECLIDGDNRKLEKGDGVVLLQKSVIRPNHKLEYQLVFKMNEAQLDWYLQSRK